MAHNHFKLQANLPNACVCYTALFWPSIMFLTDLNLKKCTGQTKCFAELMPIFSVYVNTVYSVYKINVNYHTFRHMTVRKYSNKMQSGILFNLVELG